MPACVNGNPCGFTCTNGFSAYPPSNPTACVCHAPNAVCNGQCGSPGACPSSISPAVADRRRRWLGSGSCTEMGPGWAACGVFGGGARAWECVDTARDLESCECACPGVTTLHPRFFFSGGGCAFPLTPHSPFGQDCTGIPGVADVACQSGKCRVWRCMPGYVLSLEGTHCISMDAHNSQSDASEEDDEFMQAMHYGLEHRPLQRN